MSSARRRSSEPRHRLWADYAGLRVEPRRSRMQSGTTGTLDRSREERIVACHHIQLTLRITCGPRRARTLPGTVRGDAGRSYHRKVRDRPDRQVHALVSRRHCLTFRGHAARAYPGSFTADRTPLPALRKGLKANPVATEPRLEGIPTPSESATRSMGVARGTANPESGTAPRA